MADTVLTELKIHEFDSVEQMSQHESEISENDLAFTPDEIHEYVMRDVNTGVTMVLGDADNLGARLSLTSRKSAYTDNFDGEFSLTAANDEMGNTLCGKPDGTLTWSGNPIEVIVESQLPTADNGYTWYRKYKSGWVEQGGTNGTTTVTLPVEMQNTKYTIIHGNTSGTYEQLMVYEKTTTGFKGKNSNAGGTVTFNWQVSGIAA